MTASSTNHQEQPRLLFFGDLGGCQLIDSLRELLHVKDSANLDAFFAQVSFRLRRHIGSLPTSQRDAFPRFTTLVDLVSRYEEASGRGALQLFFWNIFQSAEFIRRFENTVYPSSSDSVILSSGAGAFAAAAISCSESIASLIPLAVESSLAAFETGLKSYVIAETLSPAGQDANANHWSAAVSANDGLSVKDIVARFTGSDEDVAASCKDLWVSATGPLGGAIVSGKPSILRRFADANEDSASCVFLDITAPYHAPHLFTNDDINSLITEFPGEIDTSISSRIKLLSTSGKVAPNTSSTFVGLLRQGVRETLLDAVDWRPALKSCASLLTQNTGRSCRLVSFPSDIQSAISTALSQEYGVKVAVEDTPEGTSSRRPTGRFEQSRIAIVGYSGRFPSAASNEAFWELLEQGRDVHREIPADRFNWRTHFDETGKKTNTSRVKYGCFMDEPGLFDARFFNMSPREAENTDPAHRLAILTTYEAMEMAGFVRNRTPSTQEDRVGVFFGTTSDDWRELNAAQDIDTYFIPGGNRAFAPGRISYFFRLSGPSLSIDTACSSSFAAIQTACSYLWRGDCDTAIAGGTNVLTNPNIFAGLDRAHFLSTTGNCNAFDDGADGYCRADAVGSIILKRLEDAEADRDPILGVIVGAGTNHCGQTGSITRPHEGDQANLFQQIVRRTNYNPLDVSYVEMHGTGTQAGDAVEMRSVLSVFVPGRERTEMQPNRSLHLGSAKANVGHAESASGVTSLIKVLLMLKHNQIPPHCGIKKTINRNYPLDLAERGVHIAFKSTEWAGIPGKRRAAFLNNFSAAGGNTAILLEEAPEKHQQMLLTENTMDRDPTHLVAVTARTPNSLLANVAAVVEWLEANPSASLPALSYTTTARRMHHNYRIMASAENASDLIDQLRQAARREQKSLKPVAAPGKKAQIVFAFSGQGVLYHGLGKDLFNRYTSFRKDILLLDNLARSQGFSSFLGLIDGTFGNENKSVLDISAVVSQLALVCTQIALVKLLARWNIKPAAVVGHSLGEYAALYAAGVLSVADTVYLVGKRATLLEQHCAKGSHGMLVVKASLSATEDLLRDAGPDVELACANHPGAQVVAGPKAQVSDLCASATRQGIKTVQLEIPFAFHSSQVDPILKDFGAASEQGGIVYRAPRIPLLSPLHARVFHASETEDLNASYLVAACRSPVNFTDTLREFASEAPFAHGQIWLDVGAHPTCGEMVKKTLGDQETTLPTLSKGVNGLKTLSTTLQSLYLCGIEVDWNEYHRESPDHHQVLDLPRYKWDLRNYWLDYKGDFCVNRGVAVPAVQESQPVETPRSFKFISPAIQKVLEEEHGSNRSSLLAESDVFDERLLPIFQGHKVNGASLCPSSLYAEIALTTCDYFLQEQGRPRESVGIEMTDLKIDQPLIAGHSETSHLFRVTASADWQAHSINVAIRTVDASGKPVTSHAMMTLQVVPDQKWLNEWKRSSHLVTSRVKALMAGVDSHKLGRRMAYKLFSALVDYSDSFCGMSQVMLNSEDLEAVSTVNFQVARGPDELGIDARWIDSLGQISGFIMNANDGVNSHEEVFINHGWERLRYGEKLDATKTYNVYCRMQHMEKTTYVGDAYVLDSGRVVALYEGIKFVGMRRKVLDHVLPNKANSAASPAASPAPSAAQRNTSPKSHSATAPAAKTKHVPSDLVFAEAKISSAASDAYDRILAIISEEVGVPISELQPDVNLADVGVDSLLSLTICARIRQDLDVEIESPDLLDCASVADLKRFGGAEVLQIPSSDSSESDSCASSIFEKQASSSLMSSSSDLSETDNGSREEARRVLLDLLMEETAATLEELTPSTCLADVGIDSLLGLTITAKLSEKFDTSVPSSVVMESDTVRDLEAALFSTLGIDHDFQLVDCPTPATSSLPDTSSHPATPLAETQDKSAPVSMKDKLKWASLDASEPLATSILLSGSPASADTIVILFPDGSGSAASYANMAKTFPKGSAVHGLNCPWRKTGQAMIDQGVTVDDMVSKYLVKICEIVDSHSHSHAAAAAKKLVLGGWSAGGILAVEGVRQLREHGVAVHGMLLVDAPNPIGLQNPPAQMFQFFDDMGILGVGRSKVPPYIIEHFNGMVKVLDRYRPRPFPARLVPDTLMIYARDGVCKNLGADFARSLDALKRSTRPQESREMLWLLENRTDFSAAGWASLIGSERLAVEVVDGVNHFSMMEGGPKMAKMGALMEDFVLGSKRGR